MGKAIIDNHLPIGPVERKAKDVFSGSGYGGLQELGVVWVE
jgi:hypothetical protein